MFTKLKRHAAALLCTTALAGVLFTPRANAQNVDDLTKREQHKSAIRNAIVNSVRMGVNIATKGNLPINLGVSALSSIGILHTKPPTPHLLKGNVQGTDISYAALAYAMQTYNDRMSKSDFVAGSMTDPISNWAMGRAMMGGNTTGNAFLGAAPMIAMPFASRGIERGLDRKDDDIVSNNRLAREIITFTSEELGSDDVALANKAEFIDWVEHYSGPKTVLTEKFTQMYQLERKYYAHNDGPMAKLIDHLGDEYEQANAKAGEPITLAEFIAAPDGPFASPAGSESRAQQITAEYVNDVAENKPELIYNWLPIAMKQKTKIKKDHHKNHSTIALVQLTPDLRAYETAYPKAPFVFMDADGAPGTFISEPNTAPKPIVFSAGDAGQDERFAITATHQEITVAVRDTTLSPAMERGLFRQLARTALGQATDIQGDVATVANDNPAAQILPQGITPPPAPITENAVIPVTSAAAITPLPPAPKPLASVPSEESKSTAPVISATAHKNLTPQAVNRPAAKAAKAKVQPEIISPPRRQNPSTKPSRATRQPIIIDARTIIITSLAPNNSQAMVHQRTSASITMPHRMADHVLDLRKAGKISHLPSRLFFQLPIEAANKLDAQQAATQRLAPLFPKSAITHHPEKMSDQDYQKNLLPTLQRRHLVNLTQDQCQKFTLHLADQTLGNDRTQAALTHEGFRPDTVYNNAYRGWLLRDAWQKLQLPGTPEIKNVRIDSSQKRYNLENHIQHVDVDAKTNQLNVQIANVHQPHSTVTVTKDKITASDSTDNALAAVVASAKAQGWSSYKITATGKDLIRAARAFVVNGLPLDAQTQSAVLTASNEQLTAGQPKFIDFAAVQAEFLRPPAVLHQRRPRHPAVTQHPQVCGP